jgi:hypothetical protein
MTVITVTVISFTPVTVGTVPKSNIKIVERGKSDIPNTHIHDHSLSLLGTGTSIKSGGVEYNNNRIIDTDLKKKGGGATDYYIISLHLCTIGEWLF